MEARSLSYLTILALIPLSVIVLFQLKNLFFYPLLQESFMSILSDYFLPEKASEISIYFDSMLEKTRSFGVIGVLASLLIVLGLLSSLSRTVNRIWRKDRRSNLLRYSIKLVVMLLTIPALVIFTSLLLYSKELISTHLPGYLQFIQRIRLFQFVSLVLHWLLTALLLPTNGSVSHTPSLRLYLPEAAGICCGWASMCTFAGSHNCLSCTAHSPLFLFFCSGFFYPGWLFSSVWN
jgi:YihY family inner membrane protein